MQHFYCIEIQKNSHLVVTVPVDTLFTFRFIESLKIKLNLRTDVIIACSEIDSILQ